MNWLKDFTATHTTGYRSAATPPDLTDGLAPDARRDLNFKARLLDFWVSKSFDIGDQHARVRVGNQVINWGESLFLPGGINSTNAVDIMRSSQPGTQLKEVLLPAPMVSVASGLGHGLNIEAYLQTNWNGNYLPPTAATGPPPTAWAGPRGLRPGGNQAQEQRRGVALRYQPQGTELNLGAYVLNYQDKGANFSTNAGGTGGGAGWVWSPRNRRLYGVSANLPVGDWSVGTELSYRPRDAVSLNSSGGCLSQNGNCWVDEKKFQWHLTGSTA